MNNLEAVGRRVKRLQRANRLMLAGLIVAVGVIVFLIAERKGFVVIPSLPGEPRLNCADRERFDLSLIEMRRGLTEPERERFSQDCVTAVSPDMPFLASIELMRTLFSEQPMPPTMRVEFFKRLDGKTVGQIHEMAEAVRRSQ